MWPRRLCCYANCNKWVELVEWVVEALHTLPPPPPLLATSRILPSCFLTVRCWEEVVVVVVVVVERLGTQCSTGCCETSFSLGETQR